MFNLAWSALLFATWQTIYMVFFASLFGILGGMVLGCLLFATAPKQALANKGIHRTLDLIINITRSTPFIILMIALIPMTHILVGSSIGTNAAIVPLTMAAIPFFARICASSLSEVSPGLLEAGYAMGISNAQLFTKILLPESMASLVRGATLTIISLIGYSAMAGVVGGGGLGELAINYGYQRFNLPVMIETVFILIVFVQIVQWLGDRLARKPRLRVTGLFCLAFCLISIGAQFIPFQSPQQNTIKVGVMSGWPQNVMEIAAKVAKEKYHLQIEVVPFSDYVQPNAALVNKSIDANIFQHQPYLDAQIKSRHFALSPIGKTFVYPMGFYSSQFHHLNDLPEGALIAIPNDPSNSARALLLLQKDGLITLKNNVGVLATLDDIIENPHHFRFIQMDAAQLPRSLNDVAMAAITNDYIGPAGLNIKDAIIKEDKDSPYANIIVTRNDMLTNPSLKQFVLVMHSDEVVQATEKLFPNGAAIKSW